MAPGRSAVAVGYLMVFTGLALVLTVFKYSIDAYREYTVSLPAGAQGLEAVLSGGAEVLLDLLVRVAFLGLALAAGSVVLARGVDLLKSREEDGA
ncbi:hypothetical protein [Stetteria hydrogenophila]